MSESFDQDGADRENPGDHFDEVDAVRRFPSEEEWLDLPLPESFGGAGDAAFGDAEFDAQVQASGSEPGFVERVLQAQQDEQQLDRQIAELDRVLPTELLAQFTPPTPSGSFVQDTTAKIQQDRRQRWQEMLARYVAPEPSDVFVSRTLEALSTANQGRAADGESAPASSSSESTRTGAVEHGRSGGKSRSGGKNGAETVPWTRRSGPVFALVAAAAALLVWFGLSKPERAPLELRLAQLASPAAARTDSPSPMGAILAQVADDSEPFAMFDEPADGLWLTSSSSRSSGKGELR